MEIEESINIDELKVLAHGNSPRRLLHLILLQTLREKPSEIYFKNFEDKTEIKYKIGESLHEGVSPPKHMYESMCNELEKSFGMLEEKEIKEKIGWFREKRVRIATRLLKYGETVTCEAQVEKRLIDLSLSKTRSDFGDQYRLKIVYKS